MKTYKDFVPTALDPHICDELDHLLVAPVNRHRDSNLLVNSNWDVVTKEVLAAASHEETQIHSFGHWACGWIEILLIHPDDTAAVEVAEKWETALSDYPVADDSDLSEKEIHFYQENWKDWAEKQFVDAIESVSPEIDFDEVDSSKVQEFFESLFPHGGYEESGYPQVDEAVEKLKTEEGRTLLQGFLASL